MGAFIFLPKNTRQVRQITFFIVYSIGIVCIASYSLELFYTEEDQRFALILASSGGCPCWSLFTHGMGGNNEK